MSLQKANAAPAVSEVQELIDSNMPFIRRIPTVCILALVFLQATAEASFRIRSKVINRTDYVFLRDVAAYYGMKYIPNGKKSALKSRYSYLTFEKHKRNALINGISVHLSHSIAAAGNDLLISRSDFLLTLDPILRAQAIPKKAVRRIMIDPGHGGKDPGALGSRIKEKHLTLELANRLYVKLRYAGFDVRMTRNRDVFLGLRERTSLSNNWRADLFISIHANSTGTSSVKGVETFLLAPQGTPGTYGNKSSKAAFNGNNNDKNNMLLAYQIQKNIIAQTSANDRGVKHARFLVLREVNSPAVLIETGFISNKSEEQALFTAAYQEKIVNGIYYGISWYFSAMTSR